MGPHGNDFSTGEDATASQTSSSVYRFGPFELNLLRYELLRGGRRLRLARSPMDLLVLLVDRKGALVKREEIASRLWSDPQLVDVDQGINTAIRRIREVLLDDPAKPRFVETVIGRGYRFIAEVSETTSGPALPLSPESVRQELQSPAEDWTAFPPSKLSDPLSETSDTVSPKKRSVLGSHVTRFQIMFALGGLLAVLLGSIFVLWPRHGQATRPVTSLVQVTTNDSEQRVTAAAISPDGKWLAYGDVDGIALKVLQNGEVLPLKYPPRFRADHIAWFPNQLKIMVSGVKEASDIPEIWTVYLTGEAPQLFRANARNGVPSPDGTQVMFTVHHDSELWLAGVDGERSHPLVINQPGTSFAAVFWSANGDRASYLRRPNVIVPGEYGSADANSGKILATEKDAMLESACALPDGRVLYVGEDPKARGGWSYLWQVQTDPATGAFLSKPTPLATLQWGKAFSISSSADGTKISAIIEKGQPHVFAGDLHNRNTALTNVQRLTFDTRTDYPHGWLHDNETVIFESDRTGPFRIYKQHLQDRNAQVLSTGTEPAVLPQVTPDGKWILYASKPKVSQSSQDRLFRIPVQGGAPAEVPMNGPLDEFLCPLSGGSTCVLRDALNGRDFIFSALDPMTGKGRELARTAWFPHVIQDWCVSPDGKTVAFTSHELGDSVIRTVALEVEPKRREREIDVKGFTNLSGISWSADGQGWYVAADNGVGTSLLYVALNGDPHILFTSPGSTWGVPSPDGRKLAFVDQAVNSNVWLWQTKTP